jgi:cell wall-associated NlpC family hydrolase
LGSSLIGFSIDKKNLWNDQYHYNGAYSDLNMASTKNLLKTAFLWMNAPYLWGGKTFMGVDCSGFAQTVFKMFGIKLKRDAWQQAEEGIPVEKLSDVKEGDLGFYCNEAGRVTHVGILMNNKQIIHASGRVRIDTVDEAGIYNDEIGKRTHNFHSIRRYF